MSIIDSILRDELSRLEALQRKYEEQRRSLPKGSLSAKRRANRTYLYRALVQSYVGREDDPKVKELLQLVQKRQKYDRDLSAISSDIRRIRKMLNVR